MGQNQSLLSIFKTQKQSLRHTGALPLPTTERPRNQTAPCVSSEVTTLAEGRSSSDSTAGEAPEDLFTDLYKIMKHPDDPPNQIIILEDLRRFWHQNDRDQFYRSQSWFDGDNLYHENFLKIISILILARFRRWSRFKEIFIDQPNRRDEDLPFALPELTKNTFLGPVDGRTFNSSQWIFCPLVITEMREIHYLDGPERERRLPYVEEPKEIGGGATAEVYVVPIAPGHLKFCSHSGTVNEKRKLVALKRLYKKGVPDKEFTNLAILRKNVSQHNRIMVNIATIASASHYDILYDVAAYDLNQFLEAADPRKLHRLDSADRGHNGSHDYKPADLIKESFHLADALDFLHSRLDGDTSELACTHNDLKPENILVFFPHNEERYPVGQWKIADFGKAEGSGNPQRSQEDTLEYATFTDTVYASSLT
ncbi:hypothetical protein GTA08_BOTSDO09455 [Neofusicoccum parvum]|uniref:Uncharacterized protein n=1 Tax=Neofusicoccum parvum TaxID=310453 RepID=A0ACB5RQA8_9PEZI|nr:hypothetical protein GTA08_BOTSDO09455 [Neofusicoccum parvum]